MNNFNLEMNIGDSITEHPGLAPTYMKYHVDFCCGGHRTIEEAIKDAKADVEIVFKALNERLLEIESEGASTQKLSELTNAQIIDRILENHHKYLREELPVISELLFKLIDVHGDKHPELFEVHALFGALKLELEAHLVKEERQLFPQIELGNIESVKTVIKSLEDEHDAAGDAIHKLAEITDHYALPEDACYTYKLTYSKLEQLESDMYQHVHTENNVLFRRFNDL